MQTAQLKFYPVMVEQNHYTPGSQKTINQFDYSDREMADIMTSCVSNISFVGISGNVQFGYYSDPEKNIRLDQIQGKIIWFLLQ